jgi:hypothetical protein
MARHVRIALPSVIAGFRATALILATGLALTGCAATCPVLAAGAGGVCGTSGNTPASAPVGATGTVAPPAAAAPASVSTLSGQVILPEGPYARVQVVLLRLGASDVLATAVTDDSGRFALAVPAGLPADAILRVVARGDAATLTAVAPPSDAAKARRVLDYDPVLLSLATTVAFASLQSAFGTLDGLHGTATATATAGIASAMKSLVETVAKALTTASPDVIQALKHVTGADGFVTIPAAVAAAVTGTDSGFQSAFSRASTAIATAVREEVKVGATLPPAARNAGIGFGAATDPFLAEKPAASGNSTPSVAAAAPVVASGGASGGGSSSDAGGGSAAPPVPPSLKGVVTLAGTPRARVRIELFGPTNFKTETQSAADGTYAFFFLAPGDYTVVFAVDGAQQITRVIHVS